MYNTANDCHNFHNIIFHRCCRGTAGGQPSQKENTMSSQNGFLRFISAILTLALAIILIAAIPLWSINFMISEERIDTVVDHIFNATGDLSDIGIATQKGNKTIADVLLWSLKGCGGEEFIDKKEINSSLTSAFLKTITLNFIEDLRNGDDIAIRAEDIYEFLERNSKTISRLAENSGYSNKINIKYNEELIIGNVKELIGKNGISLDDMIEEGELKDNIGSYLEYVHLILSETTLYLSYGFIGFFIFLLLIANVGYFGEFLSACGKPAFIIGLIYFLVGLAVNYLDSIIDLSSEGFASFDFLLGYIAAVIKDVSAPVLIAGLVLIILAAIVRKKQNK